MLRGFLWHHMHVLRNSKTELKLEKQELSNPSFSSALSHQTCWMGDLYLTPCFSSFLSPSKPDLYHI